MNIRGLRPLKLVVKDKRAQKERCAKLCELEIVKSTSCYHVDFDRRQKGGEMNKSKIDPVTLKVTGGAEALAKKAPKNTNHVFFEGVASAQGEYLLLALNARSAKEQTCSVSKEAAYSLGLAVGFNILTGLGKAPVLDFDEKLLRQACLSRIAWWTSRGFEAQAQEIRLWLKSLDLNKVKVKTKAKTKAKIIEVETKVAV